MTNGLITIWLKYRRRARECKHRNVKNVKTTRCTYLVIAYLFPEDYTEDDYYDSNDTSNCPSEYCCRKKIDNVCSLSVFIILSAVEGNDNYNYST